MSEEENREEIEEIEEIEETEKPRNGRRKRKTDDSKFKELSGDDLEIKDETPDTEPVVYNQEEVESKPRRGATRKPKVPVKKQVKSVMELANCPEPINPKHWKIAQARARRKNQINQN